MSAVKCKKKVILLIFKSRNLWMSYEYNLWPFINIKELKIISIIIYINYIDVKYYDFNIQKIAECKYVFFLHTYLYIRDHPYITSALFWTLSAQENFKPIYSFITVEWRANEELIVLNQKGNQRPINLKTFYKVIWTVIFHLIQNKPIITIKKEKKMKFLILWMEKRPRNHK